jgi:glycosyltransferase involved in cell wall biosynthesis
VVDGETGALVAPEAVDEMATQAVAMLRDGDRWRRLRAGAVERARSFSADLVVPLYEDLYRRLIDG